MYFFLLVAFYFIKMIMSSLEKNYIYIYMKTSELEKDSRYRCKTTNADSHY